MCRVLLSLHLITPDFGLYFAMPPQTGGWRLIPLSPGTVPGTHKSDKQRDNLLGSPAFSVTCFIDKDTSKIMQRKKLLKPVKEIFIYSMRFNLTIHSHWNSIGSVCLF